jgi:hypothetical protein
MTPVAPFITAFLGEHMPIERRSVSISAVIALQRKIGGCCRRVMKQTSFPKRKIKYLNSGFY